MGTGLVGIGGIEEAAMGRGSRQRPRLIPAAGEPGPNATGGPVVRGSGGSGGRDEEVASAAPVALAPPGQAWCGGALRSLDAATACAIYSSSSSSVVGAWASSRALSTASTSTHAKAMLMTSSAVARHGAFARRPRQGLPSPCFPPPEGPRDSWGLRHRSPRPPQLR